jgi:hypothetical protein
LTGFPLPPLERRLVLVTEVGEPCLKILFATQLLAEGITDGLLQPGQIVALGVLALVPEMRR